MEAMRPAVIVLVGLLSLANTAQAKPYDLAGEHLKLEVSDDWHVTTDPDELFFVENANNDSFSITVTHADRPIDIPDSDLLKTLKAGLTGKGMQIIRESSLPFHGKDAISVVATITKLGFTFYTFEIMTTQGNDIVSFILVGDDDPSQSVPFKAILDTVSFETPSPVVSSTNSVPATTTHL